MYKSWYNKPREMQLQSLTALIYFAHTIVLSQAQCSLGYFYTEKGCYTCAAGKYYSPSASGGASTCVTCPVGTSSTAIGATTNSTCIECSAGTYYYESGVCDNCFWGAFSSTSGATVCTDCNPGTYAKGPTNSACYKCAPGKYAAGPKAETCFMCYSGTYSAESATACTDCRAGTYSDVQGGSECDLCPLGSQSLSSGFTRCYPCSTGTYSSALGAAQCTECPAGKYSDVQGGSKCDLCPLGSQSLSSGFTRCYPCSAGAYSSALGAAQCTECPAGKYSDATSGATSNNAGTYSHVQAVTMCDLCPLGSQSLSSGFTSCYPCNTGAYSSALGAAQCTECPAGTYSTATGATSNSTCLNCKLGTFSIIGLSFCIQCNPGSFRGAITDVWCNVCERGTYANISAATECLGCSTGTYAFLWGNSACLLCTKGTYASFQSSTVCTKASPGYHVTYDAATIQTPCSAGLYSYVAASVCSFSCTAGSYKPEITPLSPNSTQCVANVPGTYSPNGTAIPCPQATFSTGLGVTVCTGCYLGLYGRSNITGSTNEDDACAHCAVDSYAPVRGLTKCIACSKKCPPFRQMSFPCTSASDILCEICTTVPNCFYVSNLRCKDADNPRCHCLPGFELIVESEQCRPCKDGYFKADNSSSMCSKWNTTAECLAGFYLSNGTRFTSGMCLACPLDSFTSYNNNIDNPTTTATITTTPTSCTQCQPGFFTLTKGASTCLKCDQNMFFNTTYKECQTCRDTATCGSQSSPSKKCSRNNGETVCCGRDTYFIDGISTQCIPCDEGSYSVDGSGSECTLCTENSKKSNTTTRGYFCECDLAKKGLYKHNSTSNTCSFCPENNFCPFQEIAIPCPIGTRRYEGDSRANSCQPCDNTPQTGEYVWLNSSSSTRCTFQCNAGYYMDNPMEGMFMCNKCTKENFTCSTVGLKCNKTKQVCPLGQYTPACEIGRTSDNTGCRYCPAALGAIWTVLCDFTCGTGKFRNTTEMKCATCSKPACAPGQYATLCGKDTDSICSTCTNGPVYGLYNWTSSLTNQCNFICAGETSYFDLLNNRSCLEGCGSGTYRSSPTSCAKCTITQCVSGMYRTVCGKREVSDSTCELICNGTLYFNTSTKSCAVCPKGTFRSTLTMCSKCNVDKCLKGSTRTQCLIGATTDTSCIACTNDAVVGDYKWISECEYVCKYGLYHNRSLNTCLECPKMPQCLVPGMFSSPCSDEGISKCIGCKTPVTGPFNWTNQCSFTCTKKTFLENNGKNCTPCTAQCPNGTFIGRQCTATANTMCTNCSARPMPTGTFEWTGDCGFRCLMHFVWDGENCIDDTGVSKISVMLTTKLEFNNTVEEICNNLVKLVLVVINTMEEIYGMPFSGSVSAVNGEPVESVCTSGNKYIRRLFTLSSSGSSTSVTVTSTSNRETTSNNANNTRGKQTSNTLIKQNLVRTDGLNLIASITSVTQEPLLLISQPNSNNIILLVSVAVVIIVCVFLLSLYCCSEKNHPHQQMTRNPP